jgi:HK97 family phage portal protein
MSKSSTISSGFIDQLIRQAVATPPVGADLGLPQGMAYSAFPPMWEVTAPQYTYPSAYTMIREGYKTNEFAYSIIMKRARAKSSAPLWVYDNSKEHPEEINGHPMHKMLRKVNQYIPERVFWQITSIFRDIAGFSAWEIESNRMGEPIRLWPMMPHWCSFMRGEPILEDGTPNPYSRIRCIRYQPYGLPPQDIPMERILFFSNGEDYDPEFNGIRFFSPLMHAFPLIQVDNGMTLFLNDFVKHGAKFAGLISTEQTITDTVAADIKRRFQEYHGGAQNWSQPLVLGNGAKYETMQMNFKDMTFPELDARTETRICNAFDIDPICASARAGLSVSTYANKAEADKNWLHTWLVPAWQEDADIMTEQFLPYYEENTDKYYCEFYTNDVWGLSEDRDSLSKRTVEEAKTGIIDRDEAREVLGYDPIDVDAQGNPITDEEGKDAHTWLNPSKPAEATAPDETKPDEQTPGETKPEEMPVMLKKPTPEEEAAALAEEKSFRRFARNRTKENKTDEIPEYEFKFVSPERQAELLDEFRKPETQSDPAMKEMTDALLLALDYLKAEPPAPAQQQPITVNLSAQMPQPGEPNITVNVPEQKAAVVNVAAPNVTVQPPAITNTIEVKQDDSARKAMTKAMNDLMEDE